MNKLIDTDPKKAAWIAIGVLLVVLILLPGPKKIGVTPLESEALPPTTRTETVMEETPKHLIDVEYPALEGLQDDRLESQVNDIIKREVLDSIAVFKKESSGLGDEGQSEVRVRYEVAYLNPSILSLGLEYSTYTAGAAHPFNYMTTMNFDLRNGERLALKDLFMADSEHLKVLSEAAKKELDARFPGGDDGQVWDEDGALPTAVNYEEFLITREGLTVIFNPYQVAAYAAGTQRIKVPHALLSPYVDPSGVLAAR